MKQREFILAIMGITAVVLAVALPGALAEQLATQPYVFYSEEPWGGSYLGVDTDDITPERVGPLHLKEERGVEVTMVDQDAPAAKAGLKEHDVILSINDQQVQSVEQLRRLIREIPAGRTITIGISRNGQPMTLRAQLAERDKMENMDHAFNFNVPPINIPAIHIPQINMPQIEMPSIVVIQTPVRSGLMIENLTPQLGDFFGAKSGNGVLVRSVEKGSRGETAGFRAGDVVVKVNGTTVNDCSDFTRLLRKGTDNKATVTIIREHREQTLTLSVPEPKRTGSVMDKDTDYDAEDCADLAAPALQVAQLDKRAMEVDLKRLRPKMEKLQREFQQEWQSHQGEWKKEMEKMQKDMLRQKDEMKKQMKQWLSTNAEI